jgi:hypothetical protein
MSLSPRSSTVEMCQMVKIISRKSRKPLPSMSTMEKRRTEALVLAILSALRNSETASFWSPFLSLAEKRSAKAPE